MFLHLSVILFTGVLGDPGTKDRHPPDQRQAPPGADLPPVADTPWDQTPPCAVHAGRYGQQAGGTHPTGMHTCLSCMYGQLKKTNLNQRSLKKF